MLGRRRQDPRPPIEVLGEEAPGEVTTHVTVGSEPGRRRRVVLAAVAVVVAIIAVSSAVGGEDPETAGGEAATSSTTPPDRRGRSSPTAPPPEVTAPLGPVLPVQTGAALLVRRSGPEPWLHLDLDTGTRTIVELESSDGQLVGVRGGIVHTPRGRARYVPMPGGEPVDLGPGDMVLRGSGAGEVWVLDGVIEEVPSADGVTTARLVALASGRERASTTLPEGALFGATARGLVLGRGGRVYLVEPDGAISAIATGDVLGVSRSHVVLSTCDDRARCTVQLLDVETGRTRPIEAAEVLDRLGATALLSDEGDLAIVTYGPEEPRFRLGDVDGGPMVELPGRHSWGWLPSWLPDGQGLVLVDGPTGDVVRAVRDGDRVVEHVIEASPLGRAEAVVVIPG